MYVFVSLDYLLSDSTSLRFEICKKNKLHYCELIHNNGTRNTSLLRHITVSKGSDTKFGIQVSLAKSMVQFEDGLRRSHPREHHKKIHSGECYVTQIFKNFYITILRNKVLMFQKQLMDFYN